MTDRVDLEAELDYLGLLDKAKEIYSELGGRAVLSYIKSSHRLLSKVYHPDLNPANKDRAKLIQQRLNRVSQLIGGLDDTAILDLIRRDFDQGNDQRMKILLAEDEADLRDLFEGVLAMEGYNVRVAGDGEAALNLYKQFEPDLVIADVIMPVINGLDLVRRIREIDFRVKVVYISGFFGLEGMRKELEDDIRNHGYPTLAKPFKISVLLEIVNNTLSPLGTNGFFKGV